MDIAIGIIAIGIGIAVVYFLAPKTPTKTVLVTDKGRDIAHDPAKSLTDKDPKERTDKQKEKDKARGKTSIGRADKKANCVGFSLGRGDWEISTTDLDEILEDGYEEVADGKAEVCNIIVYGIESRTFDHIVLVVEKWTTRGSQRLSAARRPPATSSTSTSRARSPTRTVITRSTTARTYRSCPRRNRTRSGS